MNFEWYSKQPNHKWLGALIGFLFPFLIWVLALILPFVSALIWLPIMPICYLEWSLGYEGHPPGCVFLIFLVPLVYALIGYFIGRLIKK